MNMSADETIGGSDGVRRDGQRVRRDGQTVNGTFKGSDETVSLKWKSKGQRSQSESDGTVIRTVKRLRSDSKMCDGMVRVKTDDQNQAEQAEQVPESVPQISSWSF